MINKKLSLRLKFSDSNKNLENEYASLRDNEFHIVKLSTTKKIIEYDKYEQTRIKSVKNMKMIFNAGDKGVLILVGNLGCGFQAPYGAEFYCTKIISDITNFKEVKGVEISNKFTTKDDMISNQDISDYLKDLINNKKFEFNLGQFDEFMEIFKFYKDLSNEINNNASFNISSVSRPYYFVSSGVKQLDSQFKNEIFDQNGILKGYKISEAEYGLQNEDVLKEIIEVIDVSFKGDNSDIAKIKRAGEGNIYLSKYKFVRNDNDLKNFKEFHLINIRKQKDNVILTGELKRTDDYEEDYDYIALYDMGQKIKIESIENSLRLINQGATGAAAKLLQYLIGDEKIPSGTNKRETRAKEKYCVGLNESQKKAFLMATDGGPVSLIKGPPGTGKTHVINAIVQYITKELKERVVVSSQTHIAIDNVLDKLMENYDLVIPNRITNRKNKYSLEYIDETLFNTWGKKFLQHNERSSRKLLKEKMALDIENFDGKKCFDYSEKSGEDGFSVIGATTTTAAIAGRKGLEVLDGYDWLIIDEVSKCPITEVLRYLPYVERIIMVGDDFQLAPLLEINKDDVKNLSSYNDDLFEKLKKTYEDSVFAKVMDKAIEADRLVVLNENYRSVEQVLETYNVFYDSALIEKRSSVKPTKVEFEIDDDIDYNKSDAIFVEVLGGQEVEDGTSRFNTEEIKATVYILKDLIKRTKNPETVSVSAIFPYAAQISHFQMNNINLINEAKKVFKSFEIDTVDAFQGRETDIVLVNTVVTDKSKLNFLRDFRRINVSMSRARDKLFIFGNSRTLKSIKMRDTKSIEHQYFRTIIETIESKGLVIKYNGGEISNGNQRKNKIEIY